VSSQRSVALSAAQSERLSAAVRSAVVAELEPPAEPKRAQRVSNFSLAVSQKVEKPYIGGPTAAGWAPVPAVGDPDMANF
jgi:hypothetical protein